MLVEVSQLVARAQIEATFRGQSKHVLTQADVFNLIAEHLDDWWLLDEEVNEKQLISMLDANEAWELGSATPRATLLSLVRHKVLQRIRLPFSHRGYTRFTFGDFSTLNLLQSLDQHGYFTH